jgi:hypothetical protein
VVLINSFFIILEAFEDSSSRFFRVLFKLIGVDGITDVSDEVDVSLLLDAVEVYESELSIEVFELIEVFLTFAELFRKFISFSIIL